MIRCQHCGREVEEGRGFCPHCGKAVSGAGEAAEAPPSAGAPRAAAMSSFERGGEADKSRRTVFIAVALASALLVAALAWWATRPTERAPEPRLEGAIRPGSAEFDEISKTVVVDFDPDTNAIVSDRAIGDKVITMNPTVRNLTSRAVSGLEFRAAAFDLSGQPLKERTVVRQVQIDPYKVQSLQIPLEGIPQNATPAKLKLDLTGVRFK